jgi:hypothetical protein
MEDGLSAEESVAKMVVDHLIEFQGCKRHTAVFGDNITGMQEFVDDRRKLLDKIPQFADPDFAQIDRLPVQARLPDDDGDEVKDEWRKFCEDPLCHMTPAEWKECHQTISHIFTGGDSSEDEDGEKLDRYLMVGKRDVMFANSRRRRELARGEVSLDIDSILALFTDLSVINTVIAISIVANPMKNLKASVHLIHNDVPLHWIPHFHLGQFGHDPKFDLFIFLPALYNKDLKRRKNNLFNHVDEKLRAEFMDKCLLPAIREVVTPNESQSWDFAYVVSLAKSQAIGIEGNQYQRRKEGFRQQMTFDLDGDDVTGVWNGCNIRLRRAIRGNGRLKAFKGFQFFINSKGYKHRTHTKGFSELMTVYKEKVW